MTLPRCSRWMPKRSRTPRLPRRAGSVPSFSRSAASWPVSRCPFRSSTEISGRRTSSPPNATACSSTGEDASWSSSVLQPVPAVRQSRAYRGAGGASGRGRPHPVGLPRAVATVGRGAGVACGTSRARVRPRAAPGRRALAVQFRRFSLPFIETSWRCARSRRSSFGRCIRAVRREWRVARPSVTASISRAAGHATISEP